MARKSLKCPPTVEPNQFGCAWNFGGMFDHHHNHHGRTHRKLLSDESHGSKNLPGAGHARSQVRMLTFDEQLRNINIESKKKNTNVNQSPKGETSSSNHTRKNDKGWKNTVGESFWKKIKSRYENPNKKNENSNFVDRIVVLKPSHHAVECPVDVGCRCSYLHSYQSLTSKQHLIKHTHVSFNDVRKKLKKAKKMKMQNAKKMKSLKASEVGESHEIVIKSEKLSLVPFTKQREPEVFVEARKHLAERLRLVAQGVDEASCSSSKRVSRTLERILLSSPIHESMASFGGELQGDRGEKILRSTWSCSSPLKRNEYANASAGFVEFTCTNEFLRGDSKFPSMDSDPNNINLTGVDGHIEGSQLKFLLDVSSPKANCKLENMDNDQFRENPSPVSVLDSVFTDNISSPTSTIESVEHHLQPRRLDFEERSQISSPPHQKTSFSSFTEDREFISSYVNDIYQISQSNWEDFLAMDCPLESSCDHQLIYDCVKEVLVSLRSRVRFVSSNVRPFSVEKDVVNEVIDQVDWHNGQPVGPRTLDLLVRRDIAKCGQWVDVISDGNDIVFEVVDETLEELIMEAIFDIVI